MNKSFIVKLGLTVFFLIVLLKKIDVFKIEDILSTLNPYYFLICISITPALYLIRTYRWQLMLKEVGIRKSFFKLFKIVIIGTFYGLITPGKVGELGRVYHFSENKSLIIPTLVLEKAVDIFILSLLSFCTVLLYFGDDNSIKYLILLMLFSLVIVLYLSINKRLVLLITDIFKMDQSKVIMYIESLKKLLIHKKLILNLFLISFFYYGIVYIIGNFLLLSLGLNTILVITIPLIILIGNVPITISGIGLRESIGTICFVSMGESEIHGFFFSLLIFIIITVIPAIFGYLLSILSIEGIKLENKGV
ncbi:MULTISPECIES: lysylphosphatidylglycerol synthase transmembrane domain-containing protein [Methanohalophilus]|jgi:hypothetical protein|uniref:UPF0104 family protein n=1 Tax=Methanohalophilus euhalobius TaxID=51203 RepID=A0A315A0T6_9EURY|nr:MULTISPECIES: lysylphosphatidylglycerol synthase transmembrane domain-containing protein [Methanohalophilus]KXS46283.1 MAG: hypothetical protein AWU58_678 [Methanohalophilus sp. T328-1]OBZ34284.1 MAG: hypothetical protein A9957_04125 [Methanohalophilus sp. DAL1]PQV43134.1 hypothetical protein B0H22_103146 [Methanohalophilus euhalobius]RNI09303.1 UPF0104 family protein [Methanohalophilus euhalobius]